MSEGLNPRIPAVAIPITQATSNTSQFATTDPGVSVSQSNIYTDPGDWRYFGFSLGIVVVVLGAAGNGLTIWAYNNNRNLQTSFNVLIANLCCIELVFSLIVIPLQLPGYILKISPYPDGVCAAVGYVYYCSMGASLHNLVAIAINRYVGIVNTKKYQRLFTGNRLRLWVASIWLLTPLLYLPLPIGGAILWSPNIMRCAMTNSERHYEINLYNTILTLIYQAGGLLTLIILYSAIIKKVKQVQKKMKIHRKATFNRTKKASTRSDHKEPQTPGTTSEEEGIEDYRPSSIISGGFNFRPGKDAKHLDQPSDSVHGSDHDTMSHTNKLFSDTHSNSQASRVTPSPSPNKQERRTSLWQVLFRTKASKELEAKDERLGNTFDDTTNEDSKKEHTAANGSNESPAEIEIEPQEEVKIVLRDMDDEKKNMRRKKSLSAPTLPALEEIIAMSRKNSAAIAQGIPEKLTEANESDSTETSPRLNRAYTERSKYKKNKQRNTNGSVRSGSSRGAAAEQMKLLSPAYITNRLCKSDKYICASMPALAATAGTEIPPTQPRFGTIARKIRKDQQSKKYNKDKGDRRKQREKALRRRHARERQLVYSSLTICIAFAVCILPTSVLHVAQTIFGFEVVAAAWVVISCIAWLHAVVNPFIYGYMNHLYRKEYGRIAKDLEKKLSKCLK